MVSYRNHPRSLKTKKISVGGDDLTLYLVLWLAVHLKTAFLEVDASLKGASAIKLKLDTQLYKMSQLAGLSLQRP